MLIAGKKSPRKMCLNPMNECCSMDRPSSTPLYKRALMRGMPTLEACLEQVQLPKIVLLRIIDSRACRHIFC